MFKVFILVMLVVNSFGGSLSYNKKALHDVHKVIIDNNRVNKIVNDLEHLTVKQLNILVAVYEACKPHDLENTCIAISYKESKLGKYLFNTITGDYGVMAINLKTFINSKKTSLNYWGKKELASKLIVDNDLNISVAIDNLKYWMKITNNDWRVVWGSYNGGFRPSSIYASEILNIIKAFNIYFKKHNGIHNLIK